MIELPAMPDAERWASLSLIEMMANIGSEVGRSAKWTAKGKTDLAEGAFIRALDLFDLTIRYARLGHAGRSEALTELCRSRDLFTEAFLDKDSGALYSLDRYFSHFAMAQRR